MRRGQVAVYLLLVLLGLFLVAMLNVDVFGVVRGKNRVQNAGDAATLAAARRQGRLLNEIGALNVEHILAAARG
ncbi:MAG: pilus assembly protein TadE, partial [Kiritimatiellae bacterium]|nr:pilus assembly protein TadE [Kiritimatiellia bacterium]